MLVRRFAVGLVLVTLACAGRQAGGGAASSDPLDRALAAVGGAEKLAALRTVTVTGTAKHWEPEQSLRAGGEARFAGDSTFTLTRSAEARSARIEWVRKMAYPAPREYRFTELVTPEAGWVDGADSTAPVKAAASSTPQRHAMSGLRLAAAQRELLRSSPWLLARMAAERGSVKPAAGTGGPAVRWETGNFAFTVLFDAASGLPARVRTDDPDTIYGDSQYDLVLSDWRDVAGVKVAHKGSYELNGKEVARVEYASVQPNAPVAASAFEIPPEALASAPKPAAGKVPWQWVIRRQFIGTYLDSDAVYYDPAASGGLRLTEVAPGIAHMAGGSHNSLVVELDDGLAVLDAPVDEGQSRLTLDALRQKWPGKPVKYLVLSHHHMDHAGGARTFVAEGATVVVGRGNKAHFERMFVAPHTLAPDALAQRPRTAQVMEVDERQVLGSGSRTVELVRIDNPHVEGMLLAYVPEARLGFVVDLWSPVRDALGDKPNPGQAAVLAGVKKLSSVPQRFAGGHGGVADFAPLAALEKAPQAAR
jgi:glyoxylase-like metal-dependent hydrolase (beta-lactamase superfamily II)